MGFGTGDKGLKNNKFNPFQPSVAFNIETSHLICSANQMTGFYMKCNIGMKWVKVNAAISWVTLFKNGPSKIHGRQPLKNLK